MLQLDPDGLGPLDHAVDQDAEGLAGLLRAKRYVHSLHWSAVAGTEKDLYDALQLWEDVNLVNQTEGAAALHKAAAAGRADLVAYLLEQPGIVADLADRSGATPLAHAVANGHPACVELLLEASRGFKQEKVRAIVRKCAVRCWQFC